MSIWFVVIYYHQTLRSRHTIMTGTELQTLLDCIIDNSISVIATRNHHPDEVPAI